MVNAKIIVKYIIGLVLVIFGILCIIHNIYAMSFDWGLAAFLIIPILFGIWIIAIGLFILLSGNLL